MQQNTVGFELSVQQKQLIERHGELLGASASAKLRLTGRLDVQRLQQAISRIVSRHEIWRTTYERRPGMRFPVQVVSEDNSFAWSSFDIRALNQQSQSRFISETSGETSFDPENFRALCLSLFQVSDDVNVLRLSIPALSADRATLQNFACELGEFYGDVSSEFAPEITQYADYAQWLDDLLSSSEPQNTAAREYWVKHDWKSYGTPLPFARRSERQLPDCFAVIPCPLDFSIVECARSLNVRPQTLILAAWQVVLARLTGLNRFALAVSDQQRYPEELASSFGLFSRALPLVADLTNNLPFHYWLRNVQDEFEQALRLQNYFLNPELPSIGFTSQREFSAAETGGLTFALTECNCVVENLDLNLICTVGSETASVELSYNQSAIWDDGAKRIVKALSLLLSAAFRTPDKPLRELPIVHENLGTSIRVPYSTKCIHQLFEEQVIKSPHQPAVRSGNAFLTFDELNRRANRVAHCLVDHGVGPDVAVGLCIERSVDLVTGLLAILKAGGCYVPLVPDQPRKRLIFQLKETRASIVVSQKKFASLFNEASLETILLDDSPSFDSLSSDSPQALVRPDNLAYVIYTSGSSGVPKGVAIRHSSLVNYAEFISSCIRGYDEPLTFANISTIGADLGNTCIFPALISGGCLDVVPFEVTTSAEFFAAYARKHPIDVLKIAPYHLSALLGEKESLPRRYLFLGGEALSWDLVKRIRTQSSCRVFNHYGPTEATVGCCTFDILAEDVSVWGAGTVPIGRPIANTQIYVLDELRQRVPVGVIGELYIGGEGLAREYIHRPDLTDECFVLDPLMRDQKLYKTGDLGRYLPNGVIEFLGRADLQVKIRGFRVEPNEISSALQQHPAVLQAVAVPFDEEGEKRLAAYYVLKNPVRVSELREFLTQILPAHMVPSDLIAVEEIPVNQNGKVDMRLLESTKNISRNSAERAVPPRTLEEVTLAGIWSEVLKRPCEDVRANFFALGGHSLLATQVVSRIRDAFQVRLPLSSFLQTPTIAELVPKIQNLPKLNEERLENLLAQIENMSDEEAERLLAEMESGQT